jgi:hypothetical protein
VRTPLLAGGGEGGMLARYVEGSTLYEGSVRNFYSPFESPDASDDDEEESEYKKLGEELLTAAWRTLNSPDWKLEKKLDNGDMVQVKQVNGKRVFKLTGYVEMAPRSCSTGSNLCQAGTQPLLNAKPSSLLMNTRT